MAERTSTALAVREPSRSALTGATPEHDFARLLNMGRELITTGFLPSAIKTPAQVAAIVLTGRELGIPPMHALRSIHIIQGKPTLAAELQLGLFHRAGGKSQVKKSDATVCEMSFTHPNGSSHTETYTIDDAKRANLLNKDGWKNYPKAMLRARCISSGLRIVAPDIIAGIYDPEELGADVNESGEIVVQASEAEYEREIGFTPKSDAPAPSPAPGSFPHADEDRKIPFGRNKGKRLGDCKDEELSSLITWCSSDDEKTSKFEELIGAAARVLERRRGKFRQAIETDTKAALESDEQYADEIPF